MNQAISDPKPKAIRVQAEQIPEQLRSLPHWVLWRYEKRSGKWTKVPYSPRGKARTNDSSTWSEFDKICRLYERSDGGYDGIGICLAPGDGLVGLDVDKCIDVAGEPNNLGYEIASSFSHSYVEYSPSGKGLRIFAYGEPRRTGKGGPGNTIEVYDHTSPRYLTVTGSTFFPGQRLIQNAQTALDWLHQTYMRKEKPVVERTTSTEPTSLTEQQVIDIIRRSKQANQFTDLFDRGVGGDDDSANDMSLCNILAFYTRCNAKLMDSLFRKSKLMRDKWDEPRKDSTYGANTIDEAIEKCAKVYDPGYSSAKVAKVSQDIRSDFAKDNGEQKQGSTSKKSNFRNFRSKFNLKNEEVDQLPILPVLPDAIPFPQTSFDETIDAVQDRTQAPRVLCAQSVLAAATLAVQHLADIEIPGIGGEGARRPISSFFMTIAASGERKSSVDRIVLEGIEQAQISMESFYKDQLTKHEEDVWEYEQALRRAKSEKNGSYSDVPVEPEPPREPIFLVKEPTQEGLFRSLKRGQLSQGLFNDEGGAFLGGYGMSKDNRMRTAATFNSLWDGSKLDRPRATEHETLRGRRFAVHLMIQPKASEQVTGDAMLADLGFTARCLVAEPESTIGTRLFQEPNAHSIEICEFFAQTLQARIEYPTLKNEQGLAPRTITLTENAKQAWVKFYNEIELQLSDRYSSIQGFAGKAPEHVLRLAAMFHLFADPDAQEIGSGAILQSVELVRYYLAQHLRLEAGRPTERDEDADVLMKWLNDKWGEDLVSMADVCRRGPSKIRRREKAERAIEVCVQTGHLKPIEGKHEIKGVTRKQCFKILRESCESSAREEETS